MMTVQSRRITIKPVNAPPCDVCHVNPGLCEQLYPEAARVCPWCMEELIAEDMMVGLIEVWESMLL